MAADMDVVALFRKELELCGVGPGTSLAVLSEGDVRAGHATAFLAAAAELDAEARSRHDDRMVGPGYSRT